MEQEGYMVTKKVYVLAVLVGIIAGLGALFFYVLLQISTQIFLGVTGYIPPGPANEVSIIELGIDFPFNPIMLVLIPTIGGLISGILVYTFAPEAEGHGTDAVIEVYHYKSGYIRKQVPIIKTLASAITIGSGGSAGREGPIAQIGAGFASYLSYKLNLSEREKEVLLLCGMAAGIGSIFKSPFGGSIFGIEVLYQKDYEADSFVLVIISTFMAYGVFALATGWGVIFRTPLYTFSPYELPLFAVLGLFAGILAKAYVLFFYGLRDNFFKKLGIPNHVKPAIGGLMLGILAYFVPESLASGYGWIQLAMYSKLALNTMLVLIFAKILATSFTISSGGSGGVFAPSLVIGAMLGGVSGILFKDLFPSIVVEPGIFVLVGMACFFAGAAKVPLAAIVMVSEMTGDYNILAPAILASTVSYFISGSTSIYEKQLMNKAQSPVHIPEYISCLLETFKVEDVASPDITIVSEDITLKELERKFLSTKYSSLPVVDKNNNYIGIVSLFDLSSVPITEWDKKTVKDIIKKTAVYVRPDDTLSKAISEMLYNGLPNIPVIDGKDKNKIIGKISFNDIVKILYYKSKR
ncbi:MAG: chloride channel protein [Candidatus Njordarchaeia archaeon]